MIGIDKLLTSGIAFVLDKVARSVDGELNDETRLREQLLALEMDLELGQVTPEEYRELEAVLMERLRAVRQDKLGLSTAGQRISGVEIEAAEMRQSDEVAVAEPARKKKAAPRKRRK